MTDLDKMISKEVRGCSSCPFASFHVEIHSGYEYFVCGLANIDDGGGIPDKAPDWCPLRQGPVLVTLDNIDIPLA